MDKKKWLTLGLVGSALLLIPRRSSRQATPNLDDLSHPDKDQSLSVQADLADGSVNKKDEGAKQTNK